MYIIECRRHAHRATAHKPFDTGCPMPSFSNLALCPATSLFPKFGPRHITNADAYRAHTDAIESSALGIIQSLEIHTAGYASELGSGVSELHHRLQNGAWACNVRWSSSDGTAHCLSPNACQIVGQYTMYKCNMYFHHHTNIYTNTRANVHTSIRYALSHKRIRSHPYS